MDIHKIMSGYTPGMENILNILHDLQDAHPMNYLPEHTLREVARYLNTTLSSVYGVIGYYTMLSTKPRARHIIRVCQSPVCHLMGTNTVVEALRKHLGVGLNEPTPDGLFWVELSECTGTCEVAPAIMIDREIYGDLSENAIGNIISMIREKSGKVKKEAGH